MSSWQPTGASYQSPRLYISVGDQIGHLSCSQILCPCQVSLSTFIIIYTDFSSVVSLQILFFKYCFSSFLGGLSKSFSINLRKMKRKQGEHCPFCFQKKMGSLCPDYVEKRLSSLTSSSNNGFIFTPPRSQSKSACIYSLISLLLISSIELIYQPQFQDMRKSRID